MGEATILVVDDEAFFRQLYAELLGDGDYRIETAASGEQALERLAKGGVDVLLTDMVMPGLDGLELLGSARNLENPPDVILVTGHATVETAIQALKSGARDYLVKPFNPHELLHLVRSCLEQRRLLDENATLKNQVRLYSAGQFLASILDIETLLGQAIETVLRELGGGRGMAFLCGRSGRTELVSCNGLENAEAEALIDILPPLKEGMEGLQQFAAGDLKTDHPGIPSGLRQLLLYPFRVGEELKAALVVMNPDGEGFSQPPPVQNALFLLDQASLAFENGYRYLDARELMYTDDLTGLYNYRYLHKALEKELARGSRYGYQFSVVFIDLDLFKEVNDNFGHLVGSNTLKVVAGLLRECVREVDTLFRYGGDEFTALLVETGSEGVAVVAERIRCSIEEHEFTSSSGVPFRLTATVGFATFPDDSKEKERLIDLADRAMYLGKECRNVTRGAGDLAEK